jgi:O-antigen/teichoic acid export membrane protein
VIRNFARTIGRRGALWKLGSDLAGRAFQYALLWVAARQLSQADFGDFTFALSIGYMLAQVADFGLQLYVQRELSRLVEHDSAGVIRVSDAQAAGRLVGGGLAIKGVLSVIALMLIAVAVFLEPVGNRGALLLVGLTMVLGTTLDYLSYCFRAFGRLGWEARLGFISRLLNLILGVVLVLWGGGVWGLAVATFVSMLVAVLLGYRLLLRYVRPIWRVDWAYWRASMGQPTAVGIGIVFSIVSFRVDNLLIPPIVGNEALAVYNVAYKLFEPTLILPGVLLAAVFPMLSQAAHASTPHNLRVMVGQTHLALLAFGGLATIGLALLATPLLSLLYGAQYLASAPVLVALAFACVPMYLNYGLTHTLIAIDKPRLYALFTLASLFVNLAANLALIPILGVRGAAFATVGTEVVLLALCGGAVLHHLWQTRDAQPVALSFASGRTESVPTDLELPL